MVSGEVDIDHQGGIRPRQAREGKSLPCSSVPKPDIVLECGGGSAGCVRGPWQCPHMETTTAITQAESIVRTAASQAPTPGAAECLVCYVDRLLEQHGCDNTHRFTEQYRIASAPRHTALVKRLARMGACCCDCE